MKHLKEQFGFTMISLPYMWCKTYTRTPHDFDNLIYKYNFFDEHERFPTWADAMAHCPEIIKDYWIEVLKAKSMDSI